MINIRSDSVCRELALKLLISPPPYILYTYTTKTLVTRACTCDKCAGNPGSIIIDWESTGLWDHKLWERFIIDDLEARRLRDKYYPRKE